MKKGGREERRRGEGGGAERDRERRGTCERCVISRSFPWGNV
jgi:hypothetical protein